MPPKHINPGLRSEENHAAAGPSTASTEVASSVTNGFAAGVSRHTRVALLTELVTLPLLAGVGLPRFAAHVRTLQGRWCEAARRAAAKGHNEDTHHNVLRARRQYFRRLEQYITLAVLTADPLRLRNWTHARLGDDSEIRIKVEYDATGAPVRITEVKSVFTGTGDNNPDAFLKISHGDDRVWTWAPEIVDLDLLLDYVIGPRRSRLLARRLVEGDYDLRADLAAGQFVLFVSPSAVGENQQAVLSSNYVSDCYGRALHFVITKILRREGVPDFPFCSNGKWRGLFCVHATRLLWNTYLRSVRVSNGKTTPFSGNCEGISSLVRDIMRDAAHLRKNPLGGPTGHGNSSSSTDNPDWWRALPT